MFSIFKKIYFAVVFLVSISFAVEVPSNKLVDANWLSENLNDENIVIIDLRGNGSEYKASHIPGAIAWSESDLREQRLGLPGYIGSPTAFERLASNSGITNDSTIIFYSAGNKSATDYTIDTLALQISHYYGLEKTAILNGGFAAWQKEGGAVDSNSVNPKKTDFQIVKMNVKDIATTYDLDEAVEVGNWEIIDGRNDAQYKGEAAHPKASKAGHVENAKHIFIANFTAEKEGIFYIKDNKEEVANIFQTAGADISRPTLWYCNTGWFATGGWFMSKFVMNTPEVKVYDGSMNEYSSFPKRKVLKVKTAE